MVLPFLNFESSIHDQLDSMSEIDRMRKMAGKRKTK